MVQGGTGFRVLWEKGNLETRKVEKGRKGENTNWKKMKKTRRANNEAFLERKRETQSFVTIHSVELD
jgi:hypothetical protein